MSMTMTADAREAFLAETRIGIFTVARPDRAPLAVPIWYDYTPGGEVRLWMDRGSVKDRLLRAAGRFSLSVHTDDLPYRYVTVEGPASWIESPTVEDTLPIAARYLDDAEARAYHAQALGESSIVVVMRPEHWLSNDMTEAFAELRRSLAPAATASN